MNWSAKKGKAHDSSSQYPAVIAWWAVRVEDEAADVANFAMMISDVCRAIAAREREKKT